MQNPYFIVVFDIFVKLSPKLNAKLYRNCVGVFYMESEFKKRVLVLMSGFVVGVVVDPYGSSVPRVAAKAFMLYAFLKYTLQSPVAAGFVLGFGFGASVTDMCRAAALTFS